MRAYAEENNRLNRERRVGSEADRRKPSRLVEKQLKEIVTAHRGRRLQPAALVTRLRELETRAGRADGARLSRAPVDIPDLHPNVAGIYRRKVERLARALTAPAGARRGGRRYSPLIDHITLTPGPKRGEIAATLHGDLGTILEWTAQKQDTPGRIASGVSVSWLRGQDLNL